jgi:murein L,D-transpeptidase YcbB/YkuD
VAEGIDNSTDWGWIKGGAGVYRAKSATLDSRAELDLAFTVTVMRLVSDLYGGRVNPTKVEFVIETGSESLDLPKLVLLLRELGDLPPGEIPDPETTLYAGPIVEAVKRFQVRHGLEADGRIGRGTFLAINVPLSARVRQIEHALERWRWAPRKFDRPPIVVNLPEYSLRAFDENGQPAIVMKVVVGSAARGPTPVLSGPIDRVVFQPYWNVPYSILKNEILPKLDAGYLAENDMEIVDLKLQPQPLNEESLAGLRAGKLRLRRRPSAVNPLRNRDRHRGRPVALLRRHLRNRQAARRRAQKAAVAADGEAGGRGGGRGQGVDDCVAQTLLSARSAKRRSGGVPR